MSGWRRIWRSTKSNWRRRTRNCRERSTSSKTPATATPISTISRRSGCSRSTAAARSGRSISPPAPCSGPSAPGCCTSLSTPTWPRTTAPNSARTSNSAGSRARAWRRSCSSSGKAGQPSCSTSRACSWATRKTATSAAAPHSPMSPRTAGPTWRCATPRSASRWRWRAAPTGCGTGTSRPTPSITRRVSRNSSASLQPTAASRMSWLRSKHACIPRMWGRRGTPSPALCATARPIARPTG